MGGNNASIGRKQCFYRTETMLSSDGTNHSERARLFPQKLAGREACDALEKAGEMMGEIEAEQARGLADVVALHEQTLGLIDDVVVDIADGCAACGLADEVAEIARRIGQF